MQCIRSRLGKIFAYNLQNSQLLKAINDCRVSPVGIATRYGLDGQEIESRWRRDFSCRPDRPQGPPNLLYSGCQVFPGGKAAGAWRWPPNSS